MPVYSADAIVLRTYRYGEADRIVVFLTEDRGKKRGVAKNATRARRRFGAALEPLTRARATYVEREHRELVRLDRIDPTGSPLATSSASSRPSTTSIACDWLIPGTAKSPRESRPTKWHSACNRRSPN